MAKNTDTIIERTLENGLKVFLILDPHASLVSARTYVRAGSIDESIHPGSGLSHYLEHIVAGGSTKQHPESYYKTLISKMGGAFNAYTTVDHTSYFINTTPEFTQEAVQTLAEWMTSCKFDEFEYNRERDVIIKEIEKTQASLGRKFYHLANNNFYKIHPLRYPVIGYVSDFKNITHEELMAYYKTHYVPSNIIFVVGGNIDPDTTLKTIETAFKDTPYMAPPIPAVFPEPEPFSVRYQEVTDKTNVTHLSIRFSTIDIHNKDLYALDLLDFILSNGEGSILYKTLVEEKKLAYSVNSSSYTPIHSTGYFEIQAELDYENKDKFIEETLAILKKIKQGKEFPNLMNRAKKQKLAEDILGISNIEDKVSRIGQSYLFGHTTDFYETYVDSFKKVSKEDIEKAAQTYFKEDKMVISVLKPEDNPTSNKKKTTKTKAPDTSEKISLKNGIRILLTPDNSIPKTYFQIMMMGGLRTETSENNGIGALLSETLGKSSKRYNKTALQNYFEDKGAVIDANSGNNTFYYTLNCLSEDFEELLPIFIHTFLEPEFTRDEVEEAKRQQIQSISQRKDDWFSYSAYLFKKDFFIDHPFRLSNAGEKDSVEKLTEKDIASYFNQLKVPTELVLSVSGDFDVKKVKTQLEATFSTLQKQPSFFKNHTVMRTLHHQENKKTFSIPQNVAGIFVGFDTSTFQDTTDNIKLDLVDTILSGMSYPSGRLHSILREKGHVYMVHATNKVGLEKGYFLIYALSSSDRAEEVIQIMKDQINDIQTNLVTDEEFELALAQMNYYYLEQTSTLEDLTLLSATDELYGRGFNFYKQNREAIKTLTKEDIRETANKYLITPQIYIFENK